MNELVFFDIDGTLINGQTQKMLAIFLFKKGYIKPFKLLGILFWFLLYRFGLVGSGKNIATDAYRLLEKMEVSKFERMMVDLFKTEINSRIFEDAIKEIEVHRLNGRKIVLVSNTIYPIAMIISQNLSIPTEPIATVLETSNGCYTGRIIGKLNRGEEKVRRVNAAAVNNNWNMENCYAYGDHYSDLPILQMAKNPRAVNPDRILKRTAILNGWPIECWTKTSIK